MNKTILAAVAAAALLPVVYSQTAQAKLEEDMIIVLSEEELAGAAWALVDQRGEKTVLGASGIRDNATQATFSIDTRFHVGSIAKSLLATGILRLISRGAIDLDAPASRYLAELEFENPWEKTGDVTVRHLLDHTSGLNDAHLWQMFSERPHPDTPLTAAFPEPEVQLKIRTRPGARFSYSNMGYTLLGMIVESVTGRRYESYLDEHLLGPLGMRHSTFRFTTQQGEGADTDLAWGHVDDGSRYAASPVFLRPAAQFTTTAGDMALFAKFLLGDGKIRGEQFIDQELMRSRGQPFETEAANGGLVAGYALGLGRRDRHGVVGYCHGGNIVGFVAMLCIFPAESKAFAYSVNTDSETADYGRIDKLLIRELDIATAEPPKTSEPTADMAHWHGRYILSPNRFQAFEYLDNVFGAIKISADRTELLLESLQSRPRQLRPVSGQVYSANDRATESHVFLRSEHDEYLLSDGFKTYKRVPSAYLIAHWISLVLGLAGLVWLFIAGLVSTIRFRTKAWPRVEFPAFAAVVFLLIPAPLFFTQSFMALGDVTLASAMLALVTSVLPIGMLLSVVQAIRARDKARANLIHGAAAAFVLQWCGVLVAANMLPLRLWN